MLTSILISQAADWRRESINCEYKGAMKYLEAKDPNETFRVASKHPAAHLGEYVGWGIEVRPIESFEQA